LDAGSLVGIIANPAAARDVRRIVAAGSIVTTNQKLGMLRRVLAGLGSVGVTRVLSMIDLSGVSGGLETLATRPSAAGWPRLTFVDQPITGTASDTATAAEAMVAAGAAAIVVLGGDGTNRAVVDVVGDTPIVPISTGTNNAFPKRVEPTVAGIAAGLIAVGAVDAGFGVYRAKTLRVEAGNRCEPALVDVAITTASRVGAGALWDPNSVVQLFLCFAEPEAIGLSAIGSHLQPVDRTAPHGLVIDVGDPASRTVRAPIAPGLLADVPVRSIAELRTDIRTPVLAGAGVVAIDGERMFTFDAASAPTVTLTIDGPLVVDVARTLDHAARKGVLAHPFAHGQPAIDHVP
jgi:predicted polyphosphate/ATP-dependent NAD kinase